jgi:predicted phosphodiesterase
MKKVLVISDTHGKYDKMLEVIEDINADIIIHAGDYDNFDLKPLSFGKNLKKRKFNRDMLKSLITY